MCSIISQENLESVMDRPSDTQWTAEQNARYAAGRAETIRLANERAAKKPVKKFYLADPTVILTFWVDAAKGDVEITSRSRNHSTRRVDEPRLMSIEQARQEWLRLVDAGYTQW